MYGDLIDLTLKGEFDVIAHGCNCFCTQKRGIAARMVKNFSTNEFPKEHPDFKGDFNKLGTIDWQYRMINSGEIKSLRIVNAYTQYHWLNPSKYGIPLDYDALTLCLRKISYYFQGLRIGLPKIGCGLAGGDWEKVKLIIEKELPKCVIVVSNN